MRQQICHAIPFMFSYPALFYSSRIRPIYFFVCQYLVLLLDYKNWIAKNDVPTAIFLHTAAISININESLLTRL